MGCRDIFVGQHVPKHQLGLLQGKVLTSDETDDRDICIGHKYVVKPQLPVTGSTTREKDQSGIMEDRVGVQALTPSYLRSCWCASSYLNNLYVLLRLALAGIT